MQDITFELIRLAHEGPFESPPWASFLRALREAMGADYASIAFRGGYSATGWGDFRDFSDTASDHAPFRQLYRSLVRNVDPVPYFDMKPGHLCDIRELLQCDRPEDNEIFRLFFGPARMRWIRTVRIVYAPERSAWLTVTQTVSGEDFTPEQDALCRRLIPFVTQSLRTFSWIEQRQVGSEIAGRIARALGMDVALLDLQGRVSGMGDRARDYLSARGVKGLERGDRLQLGVASSEQQLRAALGEIRAGGQLRPQVLRIGSDCELLLAPLETMSSPARGAPVAVLFVGPAGLRASQEGRAAILADLFQLTHREAEMALLIADGHSLAACAARLGIAEQTARFYSKRIYSKIGVAGQGELIRRILTSVVMMA